MTDRFQFFSRSADAPPGEGAGEVLNSSTSYSDLRSIPHWRRILSNFAETPFEWKGLQWKTLEHAFHAAKFEDLNPELFRSFSLSSGSELGLGTGEDARRHRKAMVFTRSQKERWDRMRKDVLEDLLHHKFTQSEEARRVLLRTGTAELWHQMPRAPKEHWTSLEELRANLLCKN
jgi:predicted NAD-dependent protein-ADP-ribosyltransferase YbiA (DUF1768 family)